MCDSEEHALPMRSQQVCEGAFLGIAWSIAILLMATRALLGHNKLVRLKFSAPTSTANTGNHAPMLQWVSFMDFVPYPY